MRETWEVAGLAESTIRGRIAKFDAVGGVTATHESIMQRLAVLRQASSRQAWKSDLSCVFRLLLAVGLVAHDPTLSLPRIKAARWNPRPLSVTEVRAVLEGTSGDMHEWVTLAMWAGLRAMEIANLRGEHLELWEGGYVLRVRGKGGTDAVIPAHQKVVAIMAGRAGRLYPNVNPNIVSESTRLRFRKIGVPGGIHRCRHTFATRALAASGNDLLAVRDLLRHSSVSTTQFYTKHAETRLFEVMEMIA